ncbi:acyl-coenzyme A synthetase/AMP-(fatty) acid ligase [Enterococcus rotai]|uniref:AMP-dependent synthetase/ligase domain-containing protein n=3 Tax=Enterococcus TaxID=1350 RepID=R2S9M7_9ENTE|nr:hypothetical protein ATZ35_15165 [Enterococcus rotai]EOH92245.1 hypothetical protein UAW_03230 [Enterococcus haemoperoxidus ATCC BAA-382]EOT61930.1 hypothetical protein I583_00913 [Enterococcus haemoperoxidus ATCC BAA-382]
MLIKEIESTVKRFPDKAALVDGEIVITYRNLLNSSRGIAELITNTQYNKIVTFTCGLLFDHEVTSIIAMIGCLYAECTYIPIEKGDPIAKIEKIILTANLDMILTNQLSEENTNYFNKIFPKLIIVDLATFDLFKNHDISFKKSLNCEEVYRLPTSGSTGHPKYVCQTSFAVDYYVKEYIKNLHITANDRLTLFSTLSHDASVVDIYTSLYSGATLYLCDLKNMKNIMLLDRWLKKNKITIWHSVPTFFRYFLRIHQKKNQLNHLKVFVLGGEAVLKHDYLKAAELFPAKPIYALYGQTESSYCSGQYLTHVDQVGCLGIANRCLDYRLKLENGEIYPVENYHTKGKIGELVLDYKIPVVGSYFKNNQRAEPKSIYSTGDIIEVREAGLYYIERKDTQVKVRGHRVQLAEIESAILSFFPNIKEVIVIQSKRSSGEPKIIACIESTIEYNCVDINEKLNKVLSSYMLLDGVYLFDYGELPKKNTGKLDRKKVSKIICNLKNDVV